MAATADVFLALFARVESLPTGLPVAYPEPGEPFSPPADGKYLDVAVFSNRPAWEGLANGTLDQGLLQITVVWPRNDGLIRPAAVADAIKGHFNKATIMRHGAAAVKVSAQPWAASPLTEDRDVRIPITIPWTAA